MPISLQKRLNSLSIYVVWVSNITFFFFLNQRYILKLDYVLLSLDAEACFWIQEWRENLVILYLAGVREYICELTIGGRRNLSNNPHHFKMRVLWLQETEPKFKPEVSLTQKFWWVAKWYAFFHRSVTLVFSRAFISIFVLFVADHFS